MKKSILAAVALMIASHAYALTANRVVKASSNTYITDSTIQDNGTGVGIGTAPVSGQKLVVDGTVKSLSGGFVFPDGSTQTVASNGISAGNPISGGGAYRLLIEDGSQNLATTPRLTYNIGGLGAFNVESSSPTGGITANFTNTSGTNNSILNLTNQVVDSTSAIRMSNDFASWYIGVGGDDAFFIYDGANGKSILSIGYNSSSPEVLIVDDGQLGLPRSSAIRGTLTPAREGVQVYDLVGHGVCTSTGTSTTSWILGVSGSTPCPN